MQADLRERLLALESKYGDSRLAPAEITELVRRNVKDPNVRIVTRRSTKVELDTVVPGGCYDCEDDVQGDPCIHLELIYNPAQQHLCLKNVAWERVSFEIFEVIGHEYVHRNQQRRRAKNKTYPGSLSQDQHTRAEQRYYGESNEIEAYGYSIAAELLCYYEGDESCAGLTDIYQLYDRLFAHDRSVLLKLDQQISKYLNKLKAEQNVKTNRRNPRRK